MPDETLRDGLAPCPKCLQRIGAGEPHLEGCPQHEEIERAKADILRPSIKTLIERSSLGAGLRNIAENGLDAELRELEREMRRPRRRR